MDKWSGGATPFHSVMIIALLLLHFSVGYFTIHLCPPSRKQPPPPPPPPPLFPLPVPLAVVESQWRRYYSGRNNYAPIWSGMISGVEAPIDFSAGPLRSIEGH